MLEFDPSEEILVSDFVKHLQSFGVQPVYLPGCDCLMQFTGKWFVHEDIELEDGRITVDAILLAAEASKGTKNVMFAVDENGIGREFTKMHVVDGVVVIETILAEEEENLFDTPPEKVSEERYRKLVNSIVKCDEGYAGGEAYDFDDIRRLALLPDASNGEITAAFAGYNAGENYH